MANRIASQFNMSEFGFGRLRPGFWQDSRSVIAVGPTTSTRVLTVDQMWCQPIIFYEDVDIDAVQVGIGVAQPGGLVSVQLGRYNPETKELTIVYDFGTVDASAVATATTVLPSPVSVAAGAYLIVLGANMANISVVTFTDLYGALYTLSAVTVTPTGHFCVVKHAATYPFSGTYANFPSTAQSAHLAAVALRRDS